MIGRLLGRRKAGGPREPPPMPERLGSYQVRERIGIGSFGTVYRAYDPERDREVAIKTCESTRKDVRGRFEREARLVARLDHPNIVAVLELSSEESLPFLVQELLPGEDLDAPIARHDALTVAEKLGILDGVAAGLEHAHRLGIIHRDVKPSNVRRLPDGSIKILDFGIARRLEGESLAMTRRGEAVGSAAYMSPEQLRGETLDARTDLFSLGVLAYELLTFVQPFAARDLAGVFHAVEHREPDPVWQLDPTLGPDLDAWLRHALAKRREDRFASAAAMREELVRLRS